MAYITAYNAASIIRKIEVNSINTNEELYLKDIYFFNEFEKKQLLAYKELVRDTEKFIREFYKPIELKRDSFRLVHEYQDKRPAYHLETDCPLLNADYENYTIPDSIRLNEDGSINEDKVKAFRKWFREVEHLFKRDKEAFVIRLFAKWKIRENPEELEASNSGIAQILNYDIEELIEKLDDLIKEEWNYYNQSTQNAEILRSFRKKTFLAYKSDPIYDNNTGLSDTDLKIFLKEYDQKYKWPLKIYLKEYYRLKYNPELEMEGILLDKLNFKLCMHCTEHSDRPIVEKIDMNKAQFREHATSLGLPQHVADFEEYFRSWQ